MAFEVIARLSATPNRIYAMLKLLDVLGDNAPSLELLYTLMQPNELQESKSSAEAVYGLLRNMGLVTKAEGTEEVILITDKSFLSTYEDFRLKMQSTVLGAIQPEDSNFLLSQITAWYASYNQKVLTLRREDIERKFHEDLYPSVISQNNQARKIQDTMLLSWGLWTHFLGFGKEYALAGGQRKLMPNAYIRIRPLLKEHFPHDRDLTIQQFIDQLAAYCPELDGGAVYNKVYESIHRQNASHASLSLMLSTALRNFQVEGIVELIDRADSLDTRQLFPSQSYLNRVSHIRIISEKVAV